MSTPGLPEKRDSKERQFVHQLCTLACWHYDDEKLRGTGELISRSKCWHRYHKSCLQRAYSKADVPALDWCFACSHGRIPFWQPDVMQELPKLVSKPEVVHYLFLPLEQGTLVLRPHFLLEHQPVLASLCSAGELLDFAGYRNSGLFILALAEHVDELKATGPVWRKLADKDPHSLVVPNTYKELRGALYYQQFAAMLGLSLTFGD